MAITDGVKVKPVCFGWKYSYIYFDGGRFEIVNRADIDCITDDEWEIYKPKPKTFDKTKALKLMLEGKILYNDGDKYYYDGANFVVNDDKIYNVFEYPKHGWYFKKED